MSDKSLYYVEKDVQVLVDGRWVPDQLHADVVTDDGVMMLTASLGWVDYRPSWVRNKDGTRLYNQVAWRADGRMVELQEDVWAMPDVFSKEPIMKVCGETAKRAEECIKRLASEKAATAALLLEEQAKVVALKARIAELEANALDQEDLAAIDSLNAVLQANIA